MKPKKYDNKKYYSLPKWVRKLCEDVYGVDPSDPIFIKDYALNEPLQVVSSQALSYAKLTVETWNTATKTLALSDANKLFKCSHTDNQILTIPTNASVPFPIGTMITFLLESTYKVTFVGGSSVILTSMDSLVELATIYGMASLIKIDTNTWQLVGAL